MQLIDDLHYLLRYFLSYWTAEKLQNPAYLYRMIYWKAAERIGLLRRWHDTISWDSHIFLYDNSWNLLLKTRIWFYLLSLIFCLKSSYQQLFWLLRGLKSLFLHSRWRSRYENLQQIEPIGRCCKYRISATWRRCAVLSLELSVANKAVRRVGGSRTDFYTY